MEFVLIRFTGVCRDIQFRFSWKYLCPPQNCEFRSGDLKQSADSLFLYVFVCMSNRKPWHVINPAMISLALQLAVQGYEMLIFNYIEMIQKHKSLR